MKEQIKSQDEIYKLKKERDGLKIRAGNLTAQISKFQQELLKIIGI